MPLADGQPTRSVPANALASQVGDRVGKPLTNPRRSNYVGRPVSRVDEC